MPDKGRGELHVGRPHLPERSRFDSYVDQIYENQWLTNSGPLVERLEGEIAEYLNVRHCVAVSSGTAGLSLLAHAAGLTGEVILPSFTFVATAHALLERGLTPVFADIDPETHTLDPEAVRSCITDRTSAIVGVHLWGTPADTTSLEALAQEHRVQIMYDAAHAFGVEHESRMIGNYGRAEVFSFHATKAFHTVEGGAVTTNDDELAERLRLIRNFGFRDYDEVVTWGTNAKMSEMHAAMGLANLSEFSEVAMAKERNFQAYALALSSCAGARLKPHPPTGNHQYMVLELMPERRQLRDELIAELHRHGVLARRYFWPGVHRMAPYSHLDPGAGQRLPVTNDVASRVVVLPNGTDLDDETISWIAEIVARVVDRTPGQ